MPLRVSGKTCSDFTCVPAILFAALYIVNRKQAHPIYFLLSFLSSLVSGEYTRRFCIFKYPAHILAYFSSMGIGVVLCFEALTFSS